MNLKTKLSIRSSFRKTWMCVILAFSCMAMSNAQSVKGTVTADGQPLPGATVLIKGTSQGTTTDFDGEFTIKADALSTLVISYIGYSTKEILVGNQTQINVSLEQDNKLD
ncbi:carboxypeptidase-like regulatory domain-containing protein [uncultured Algibacter sp.]|uniref:carboxypeptidase-like regulatory domain-containing protein n=1 Tax=uncultured Algibacter sp. TaxID=298659 RepID=UPI0026027B61|nr:carboxypeptidase-like regulatory domain-containing protein [uncultured Algibacter sp.]